MIQIGTLPLTGKIDFTLDESSLLAVHRKLIQTQKIEAIISFPELPTVTKKKISLMVNEVMPPGSFVDMTAPINKQILNQMQGKYLQANRALDYFYDLLFNHVWIIYGALEGQNKIPICITYSSFFQTGTYSFKTKEEILNDVNPKLN